MYPCFLSTFICLEFFLCINGDVFPTGTFVIYAAVNALAIVFVVKVVPETKGKTLEQIQAAIN